MIKFENYRLAGLFLVLVALFALSGCATIPSVVHFPYETIKIKDYPYFAVVDMCDNEGVKWDYDPLSKEVVLKKDATELRLLVGSREVLVGSDLQALPAPVVIRDSVIFVPVDLRKYIFPELRFAPLKKVSPEEVLLRPIDTIVIDAGHGGIDPGAIGRYGLKEKTVVLDVAKKVADRLKRCGIQVYMSRPDDECTLLATRPDFANKKKADLFVSIHANANTSRRIEGFEVYYLAGSVDDNARALFAAQNYPLEIVDQESNRHSTTLKAILWDMVYSENRRESVLLASHISDVVSKDMNLNVLAIKGASFVVLKGTRMPAVLVEIGYISNKEGEKKLSDSAYRERMAEAIAKGIVNFKNYSEGRV